MSGLEIVGVILGAFPLAISAMEHYEECKKVAGTFYKIRRAHRKDFGRVKDCQLKFRLNMKELLLPLLADDLVSKIEYEQLLASPGGPGWQEDHVEESLVERLGDCHERYIEILKEMEEAMVLLCKATKVDDEQFQALLKTQNSSANTPTERARSKLMSRSYATLQAKKVAYAFTIPQRESLLEEIESFNAKLENVLVANDRIFGLTRQTVSTPSKPRIPKALLHFWRHADSMFKLLSQAWTCHCKGLHCARVWLKQRIASTADMKIVLQFCHDTRKHVHLQLAESPSVSATCANSLTPLRLPLRPIPQQFTVPSVTVQSVHAATKVSGSGTTVTLSRTESRVSWAQGCQQQQQYDSSPSSIDLGASDLCETLRASSTKNGECYGGFTDVNSDRYYTVSALESPSNTASTITLAEIINSTTSVTLTRIQRYSIAATLASSLLQLESTSWSKGWTANDVHFAHDINTIQSTPLAYDKPFFLTPFTPTSPTLDDRFKSIGTLLLELCFGKLLDQHELWQQAGFSAAKTNFMMRHFVACEWSKDVEGEAGEQYANAVQFCLHQGPAVLQDDKWRTEFAQAVVWPLQQCYESMQPSKRVG